MNEKAGQFKQYLIVTGNYWAFTLTDGALRMLVVLYFHQLGYSPLQIAMLFLFYEFFGVVTNLLGGWLGARWGLNRTMNLGLVLQVVALAMLLVPSHWLGVIWVMSAQALSGIAKDLNKMSAKSAVKHLIPDNQYGGLYRWVAILTGSKNTLKGVGFFMGGLLLSLYGFRQAVLIMAIALGVVWLLSLIFLGADLGKSKAKPKFTQILAKKPAINWLSAARLFLFAARDVWFVVALPVFLSINLNWDHWQIGGFMAVWIIFYGIVQAFAPQITGKQISIKKTSLWILVISIVPILIALGLEHAVIGLFGFSFSAATILIGGLLFFGFLFAVNSSLHSYWIVQLADKDNISMDVGFYYMANASGRLLGTILSGVLFQVYGLSVCLYVSSLFLLLSSVLMTKVKPAKLS